MSRLRIPVGLADDQRAAILAAVLQGLAVSEVATRFHVSFQTVEKLCEDADVRFTTAPITLAYFSLESVACEGLAPISTKHRRVVVEPIPLPAEEIVIGL